MFDNWPHFMKFNELESKTDIGNDLTHTLSVNVAIEQGYTYMIDAITRIKRESS